MAYISLLFGCYMQNNFKRFGLRCSYTQHPKGSPMFRITKVIHVSVFTALVLTLSGCSTLSSAYDSVTTTVSDMFKSDDAKK